MGIGVSETLTGGAAAISRGCLLMKVATATNPAATAHADGSTNAPIAVAKCDWATTDPIDALDYDLLEVGKSYALVAGEALSTLNAKLIPTSGGTVIARSGAGLYYFTLDKTAASGSDCLATYTGPHYTAS